MKNLVSAGLVSTQAIGIAKRQRVLDKLFYLVTQFFALSVLLALLGIIASLVVNAYPAFQKFGFGFFTTVEWDIINGEFGGAIAIYGTLITSVIALLIAVPLSFGIAVFLTEICPKSLRRALGTAIEILAAVPSIIYGMFGLFIFAPLFADYIQPALAATLGQIPGLGILFSGAFNGIGILCAGLILAMMILPFIASVMRDVFEIVPPVLKESAYGIGCTTWEVVRNVVLPYTKTGVIGGIMLGLGRALGETMAVTFVIGNAHKLKASLFAPGNSIASTLANEFGEAEIGAHYSSLFLIRIGAFCDHLYCVVAGQNHADAHGSQSRSENLMSNAQFKADSAITKGMDQALFNKRKRVNAIGLTLSLIAMSIGMVFLFWILSVLLYKGFAAISPSLFLQSTPAPGTEGGGLANPIVGSLMIVGACTFISTPIGILAGIYLSEYGNKSRFAEVTRFVTDIMLSAPSIVVGLFVYAIVVYQVKHFSGWAGTIALSLIAIPVVVRTTENMLRLVPLTLREAAYALGSAKVEGGTQHYANGSQERCYHWHLIGIGSRER